MHRRLGLALTVFATVASGPLAAASPQLEPLHADEAALQGIWRSRGYGWLIEISGGKLTVYDEAGSLCTRDLSEAIAGNFTFRRIERKGRIVLASGPGETAYRFDRLPALPAACNGPAPPIGAFVAGTFAAFYPGFAARGIDRGAWLKSVTGADAAPPEKQFDPIARAMGELSDAHVGIARSSDGRTAEAVSGESGFIAGLKSDPRFNADPARAERAWLTQYRRELLELLGPQGKLLANNRIFVGRVGGLGYLGIMTMGGFEDDGAATAALDRALDQALGEFRDLPGVIVDVSNNRGGYDAISRHIAARFAARPTRVYAKRPAGTREPWQHFTIAPPAGRPGYAGPVWLVTSDVTVSAGESFVMAMRALANVRHVGETTRGDLSDEIPKQIAGGWTFTLSAEHYRDSRGRFWEGRGIPPHIRFPIAMDRHAASIAALASAIESGKLHR